MKRHAALALLSLVVLSACSSGQTQTFKYEPAQRSEVGPGKTILLFAADDQRDYIVKGEESAAFVGEQQSPTGIPFKVTTRGNRPFAEVVQEAVQRDLEAAGFRVIARSEKAAEIGSAIAAAGADKAMSVIVRDFASDTSDVIKLAYSFEAVVYDHDGNELLRNATSGNEAFPGSPTNPAKAARQQVPPFFNTKIHQLVTGNERVVTALTQ
ncbi:MAG TPA: hypothetical protein VF824_07435 [Thermoanaerobaculia bacterium]|jgi:hypothetical protein